MIWEVEGWEGNEVHGAKQEEEAHKLAHPRGSEVGHWELIQVQPAIDLKTINISF